MRSWIATTALALVAPVAAVAADWGGELRVRRDTMAPNASAASVQGHRLNAEVPPLASNSSTVEANLRGRWQMINADLQWAGQRVDGGRHKGKARVKELYALVPLRKSQLSFGRRFVEWDVGFGFRPNDLVQQNTVVAQRRGLLSTKPIGRDVILGEYFWNSSSLSLAWVNPQNVRVAHHRQLRHNESALAAMLFVRNGQEDLYAFARYGHRTGSSVGLAFSGVVSDSLNVYASGRVLQRYDGWILDPATPDLLQTTAPWRQDLRERASQGLIGFNWTGAARQSLAVEWWYDGTTLSNLDWNAWQARKDQLVAAGQAALAGDPNVGPPAAIGANLGWQDWPLGVLNQRRHTFLVRMAWQPDPWLTYLDTLFAPADSGRTYTAGLQWQGDSVRLDAAIRWFDGPASTLSTQLPARSMGLVAMTWAY